MSLFKRIDHTAIHVRDINKSKQFYKKHFGFQIYFEHETPNKIPIAYLRLHDTVLELTGIKDLPVKGFHFCLETVNFDEAIEKLVGDGVQLIQAPHKTAARHQREKNWKRAVFKGPDGEHIEIRG